MSGLVNIKEYAVVYIWVGIFSIYSALLTVTALGVVFVLRKRRSSILKNQRTSRVPFSELEFNVTTPTETSKSRRVSFSKRTGVAEFVTNEATTTWKNFYEEHNKSLESSGNESAANAPRQTIDHIGKQLFDQQFEEIEIVDIGGSLYNNQRQDFHMSINNGNFTQQLAALEFTNDIPNVPQKKFEQSSMTDHQSKLFNDDFSEPIFKDIINPINVNFSVIQPNNVDKCDDLDEIQKDIERSKNHICHGPVGSAWEQSEYVKVDLDMTHAGLKYDESDMSITDPVLGPVVKVQPSNDTSTQVTNNPNLNLKSIDDKENIDINPFIDDKENIVVNPYITPKESINFAINEVSDKVLVFDGKRLKIQSDLEALPDSDAENQQCRKTILSNNNVNKALKRKTITLNINDDLPNFITNNSMSNHIKTIYNEDRLIDAQNDSIKKSGSQSKMPRRNTIVFDDDLGDISFTQCIPAKVIMNKEEKLEIVPYDIIDKNTESQCKQNVTLYNIGNMSVTSAIPDNLIKMNQSQTSSEVQENVLLEENVSQKITMTKNVNKKNSSDLNSEEIKTNSLGITEVIPKITEMSHISDKHILNKSPHKFETTQQNAKPINRKLSNSINQETGNVRSENNSSKTVVYENDTVDLSFTQIVPSNIQEILKMKKVDVTLRNTDTDMTMTCAVPTNLLISEIKNGKLIIDSIGNNKDMKDDNISVNTINQNAVNVGTEKHKRKSIVYDNDTADLSFTQMIPNNIQEESKIEKANMTFKNTATDMTMTCAVPTNLLSEIKNEKLIMDSIGDNKIMKDDNISVNMINHNTANVGTEKNDRKSIVYDNDTVDLSLTQMVPNNIQEESKMEKANMTFKNTATDMTMTCAVPTNLLISEIKKEKLIIDSIGDIKIMKDDNISLNMINQNTANVGTEKNNRKSIAYDNDTVDLSLTQMIPNNIQEESKMERENMTFKNTATDMIMTCAVSTNLLISEIKHEKLIIDSIDYNKVMKDDNISVNKINQNTVNVCTDKNNRKSIVYDNDTVDLSFTQIIPSNIQEKSKIEKANMTLTRTIPNNILMSEFANEKITSNSIYVKEDISMCNKSKIQGDLGDHKLQDELLLDDLNKSKSIPTELININDKIINISKSINTSCLNLSSLQSNVSEIKQDILVYQVEANKSCKQGNLKKSICDDDERDKSLMRTRTDVRSPIALNASFTINNIDKTLSTNQQCKNFVKESPEPLVEKVVSIETNLKSKTSILNELLDMSSESIEYIQCKSLTDESNSPKEKKNLTVIESKESFLIITDEVDSKTNVNPDNLVRNGDSNNDSDKLLLKANDTPMLEYKESTEDQNWKNNLSVFNKSEKEKMNVTKEPEEKSSDVKITHNSSITENLEKIELKSLNNADDTGELLEMISGLTGGASEDNITINEKAPVIGNKSFNKNEFQPIEPKRLSFAPQRRSIAMSREDLLNNISMAQAALQQSQFKYDESENLDESSESPESPEQMENNRSPRVSSEVVKTLKFEDESNSDSSLQNEDKKTILKKTTFEDTSYVKESKAKVIPTYLKEVSEDIKALMNDLVKPSADLNFEDTALQKNELKTPSTCNTEIQANLVTSSQIDIDVELHSETESFCNLKEKESVGTEVEPTGGDTYVDQAIQNVLKSTTNMAEKMGDDKKTLLPIQNNSDFVLVFDQNNPLNNVILSPLYANVHEHNPIETTSDTSPKINEPSKRRVEITSHVSIQNNIQTESETLKIAVESQSVSSNTIKTLTTDKATEGIVTKKITSEVNTLITMKKNKELLDTNSSLTLVDDALAQSNFDVKIDLSEESSAKVSDNKSAVHIIYKVDPINGLALTNSEFTSIYEESEDMQQIKPQKRCYSPQQYSNSEADVTPKPINKIKKMSNSPLAKKIVRRIRDKSSDDTESDFDRTEKQKSKHKGKSKKEKSSTVQQLLTQYNMTHEIDKEMLDNKMARTLKGSPSATLETDTISPSREDLDLETVTSFTSCKEVVDVKDVDSGTIDTQAISSIGSNLTQVEWQQDSVSEISSKNLEIECNSSSNVVAKINTLPFMGRECIWEWSGGDSWSFRLLKSRLRMSARLEHRHHNAPRSRVRADTPVLNIIVEPIYSDEKDPLAALSIQLAREAMMHESCRSGDITRAGEFPSLLRRCAAISRLALHWARAMHDARARLVYSVTQGGTVVLKVASIPLRSVWEVTFNIKLVTEFNNEIAWPQATDLTVRAVLADGVVPIAGVKRIADAVPKDWGHAPRIIWRVFKYLKNKTTMDDLLLT